MPISIPSHAEGRKQKETSSQATSDKTALIVLIILITCIYCNRLLVQPRLPSGCCYSTY